MAFYVVTSNPKFYGILLEHLSDRLFIKTFVQFKTKTVLFTQGKKKKNWSFLNRVVFHTNGLPGSFHNTSPKVSFEVHFFTFFCSQRNW